MFFFKQKTAYDMRISDWSSDVCSSDLKGIERDVMAEANEIEYARNLDVVRLRGNARIVEGGRRSLAGEYFEYDLKTDKVSRGGPVRISIQIGRASCRDRVCT